MNTSVRMRPIVTDTSDFPTLIRDGNVYVDKTGFLHRLVSKVDGTQFFMSRPRRFGKSLMISTLEQIFKGERALFNGLAIDKSGYDWIKYPIIRLDMTAFDHTSGLGLFKSSLAAELGGTEPIAAFRALIDKKAKTSCGRGVVILIDEYDSPVSGLLGKPKELEAMREFLQAFYRILKEKVGSIRFLMMTGVSKFTKLSVFSGLNNLTDLTMDSVYAGLLGYSSEELNQEVRESVYGGFLDDVFKNKSDEFLSFAREFVAHMSSNVSDVCVLRNILTSIFSMAPHEWKLKSEAEAKRYFLLFMRMAGATINAEVESANGRADAILETTKDVYIFEFKCGKSARAALKQCRDRNYAAPYAADKRTLSYVGVNYNGSDRSVDILIDGVNEVVKSVPGVRKPDILKKVKKSRATIERALARLTASKRVEFRGAPKTGGYYAVESK